MAKPVILAIDDEPGVLAAVRRDLLSKYSDIYRVVGAGSGQEALDVLTELLAQDADVALLLADQRMPVMTGVELLARSKDLFPEAKRALLTAYADTEAAIGAINDVKLDFYIMKPWDPPEERLYPVLDDLLDDWWASHRPRFTGIKVVGHRWSRPAHDLKIFLGSNQIPYRSLDPEDEDGRALMARSDVKLDGLPLVVLEDGTAMTRPSLSDLASKLGLQTHASSTIYDLAIVGGGPSGLAAAVYGASEGLATVLIEQNAPGGQAGTSSKIENYLGFPQGVSGADLARRATTQATKFGVEILVPARVESVRRNDPYKVLTLEDGSDLTTKALLVTSGVSYRTLNKPGLEDLSGAGVYYGTSRFEAVNHTGEKMFVVGGGNSAGQAAMFLTGFTDSVTILIRGSDLSSSMSQYLIDVIEAEPGITVLPRTQVVGAKGSERLESLILEVDGSEVEQPAGAVFIFIGQAPHTSWIADLVETDERGFITTGSDLGSLQGWTLERDPLPLETNVPGIFAAGDVRHGSTKRVATSTGEGATAISYVHRFLGEL
jgi:thioredoxin reductase (NADPH)